MSAGRLCGEKKGEENASRKAALVTGSRKALAMGQLVIIILAVASFLAIAGLLAKSYANKGDKDAEVLCRQSVQLRANTALQINPDAEDSFIKATIKAVPVMCKTLDYTVSGEKEEVMGFLAEKMARCWWMFGEGRIEELLHGSKLAVLPDIFGVEEYENKCFTCYSIVVEALEDGEIAPHEFMNYLANTNYEKVGKTYLEYIQSYGGPGSLAYLLVNEQGVPQGIKERHAYGISMAPKLKPLDETVNFWEGVGKVAIAGAGAFILGAATGGVGWAVISIAGATALAGSGYSDIMSAIYGERGVSAIYLTSLEEAQRRCGSGDLEGR